MTPEQKEEPGISSDCNCALIQGMARAHGLKLTANPEYTEVLEYRTPTLFLWITPRPYYCDRGRWQVNAESQDICKLFIDESDGFPRYYFNADALVTEVVSWLKARKQWEIKQ